MRNKVQGITIVGLGPGNPLSMTRRAWQVISDADEVYLRTKMHPVVEAFPRHIRVMSFDNLYEASREYQEVYRKIVTSILELARTNGRVIYAVPGHPFVAEATTPAIVKQAKEEGIPCEIVGGMSFLEPVLTALEIDPFPQMDLVDALELTDKLIPTFSADRQIMIVQIYSKDIASQVKLTLMNVYPDEHSVSFVHAAGTDQMRVEELPLYQIDRSDYLGNLSTLYVPRLEGTVSLETFQNVVARLRAPDGCPWDREQTHQSLRANLIEETYEVLAAIDADDADAMAEEFGDLLLHIVLHAQIASEEGTYSLSDVIRGIHQKIVRRHPHVFGDVDLTDSVGVIKNWERLKAKERAENGEAAKGVLGGVPDALPALVQAETYQKRVARVGFDWKEISSVIDKICEEVGEVKEAKDDDERSREIGDLLFSIVNLARWYEIDAESALREANQRFRKRFQIIEKFAQEQGRDVSDMTLDEMERYWQEAKRQNN